MARLAPLLGALVGLAMSGCLEVELQHCADGRVCPEKTLCDDIHGLCVTQAQLSACDESDAPGRRCTYPGQTDGECHDGVCLPVDCGNGIVEPGERCDDGNVESGDGCSRDCQSREECGNGVVDSLAGETCDDGGTTGGDGCGPTCVLERCGNGIVDDGETCDDGNVTAGDGCGPACLVEGCGNGFLDPGEGCDDGATEAGDGCGPSCVVEICGNGIVDPGEACDDGNLVSLDGCSAECASAEVCGNGYTDYGLGETCDDGNFLSRDGCSSGCQFEALSWGTLPVPEMPSRKWFGLVFDAARGRSVLFGGRHAVISGMLSQTHRLDDTWEWAGHNWVRVPTETAPPPRESFVMAYDSRAGRVIVHGGRDNTTEYDDFWAFDGRTWTDISQPGDPSEVQRMVFDPARGRMIALTATDSWELDGATWTQTAAGNPGGTVYYDAVRRTVAALVGDELRNYAGATWALARTLDEPAPGTVVYDLMNGRLVAISGSETWELTGTSWTQTAGPAFYSGNRSAFDIYRKRTVQFSCEDDDIDDCNQRPTLEFDGTDWVSVQNPIAPPPRTLHPMVTDPVTGAPTVFGGLGTNASPLQDLWRLRGDGWEGSLAPTPASDFGGAAAYDARRRRVVAVQLLDAQASPPQATTDLWNGLSWVRYAPSSAPPATAFPAMTYDAARDRTVLLTGYDLATSATPMEVWELDGGQWSSRPAAPIGDRGYSVLSYDAAGQQCVLFGGMTEAGTLADTWQYDGAQWSEAVTSAEPGARMRHAQVFDPRLGETLVLLGSEQPTTDPAPAEPWIFDGSDWRSVRPLGRAPTPRQAPAGIYDTAGRRTVLFGGGYVFATLPEGTHTLSFESDTPDESCADGTDDDGDLLVDCDDPDCRDDPRCPELDCGDGVDNDGDYLVDCADRGCDDQPCGTGAACYRGACEPCTAELGRDPVYTACAVPTAFEDISATGTLLGTDDDGYWTVDLPFEIALYAEVTSRITVQSNGAITTRDGPLPADNQCLPAYAPEGGPIVAALWDDLAAGASGEGVYYEVRGEPHDRRVIVQWELRHAAGSESVSFQAVLFQATGHVELRYRDVDFGAAGLDGGAGATAGLVGTALGPALELSCDSAALTAGTAIALYRRT